MARAEAASASARSDSIKGLAQSIAKPAYRRHVVERLQLLSDHKEAEFGEKYGVLLLEPRIFRRAIFVVDRAGKIANADYLPVLGEEPDYAKVLEVARQAIG